MGDHTESLQVDFDPGQITYTEIANRFWGMHNPCATAYSRQYMSAIWYNDAEQKSILEETLASVKANQGREISTPILPLDVFHHAENYHQKYRLQSYSELMKGFAAIYPNFNDFNDSTAAARLNGYVSGHGSTELFELEVDSYGFSREELRSIISV